MVEVGGIVPLSLQLFDGRDDLKVVATVLDPDLRQVAEVELRHTANGLYITRQVLMPDVSYLIANYIVYDGDEESEDYERASDVFYAMQQPVDTVAAMRPLFDEYSPKKDDYLTGQVIEETIDESILEGKIRLGTAETSHS